MNYIFVFLILISFVVAAFTGRIQEVLNAMLISSQKAVEVAIYLTAIMAFWLGIVKIAQKSGLIEIFAKLISPFLRLIFNELPENSPAFSNIALNITANALGLMNASTPFGIKAMQDLKTEAKGKIPQDCASNSMCIFLAMNTAGFQLIPAAVIAVLAGYGAENPFVIILPAFIVTFSSFIFAIAAAKILSRFYKSA